ncbi:hypothetical protein [Amycolatopsis sp. CA-128772]|uniref:hypothetical protein n=1 Tax=Amycolatopsis sp. CA-128772 TaxID=2073159 RepID=UPI000CD21CAB|nr:hypothetical protein [Amycolatopsis sp. CA-128772]
MITAVDGTGGVGKTMLALHWARRVEQQFPDGSLFVNLRGYGPGDPLAPGEALDLMSSDEAGSMLRTLAGPAFSAANPGQVDDLIRLCARLPLALRIAAARLAEGDLTVADLIAELADEQTSLDSLRMPDDEEVAVRAIFDSSYRMLDVSTARLFRLLGLIPGPDISTVSRAPEPSAIRQSGGWSSGTPSRWRRPSWSRTRRPRPTSSESR